VKFRFRNAPLRFVLLAALAAISLALVSIAILEHRFVVKINRETAQLSQSAQRLQKDAGEMRYIVVNTQRLAFNSMLTANQDLLLLAPAQSERFYELIDEMKEILDGDPQLKAQLDELKQDYRNFLFKVIGVAAQYIERIETRGSVLRQVNTWTEDFVDRLTRIAEEVSKISESKVHRIDGYSKMINQINFGSLFAVMIAMLALAAMIEWKLFQPLNLLMAFVRGITESDTSVQKRIDNQSKDEIGELGRSINHMLDNLNQTTVSRNRLQMEVDVRRSAERALREIKDHLEEQVALRTKALQESYEDLKREIEERKQTKIENDQLQSQLRQVQKMDALGTLAGGVAHDFNNIMAGVLGFAELALLDSGTDSVVRKRLDEIVKSARRGADLTSQLLTFSRHHVAAVSVVDLNVLIDQMLNMLNRLVGENIKIKVTHEAKSNHIKADPRQVEQVLMNLVLNARDAMPGGGVIGIRSSTVCLVEGALTEGVNVPPGRYTRIAVSDTGHGMDEKTCEKVFEPFFTTKSVGKGTGLGLSTVYGIVKNNKGFVDVRSVVGRGTEFDVYFPLIEEPAICALTDQCLPDSHAGLERCGSIMLVEDEIDVLESTRSMLEKMGHRVGAFQDPMAAEAAFTKKPSAFDLLLSDVIMPECDGPELYAKLLSHRSDLRAVFMSGYAKHHIPEDIENRMNTAFVQKPFSYNQLQNIVNRALATIH
jgi:signal transduction histidine kinase/CheY-like chemotaxis protein